MSNFLEVVGSGRETQLQVGENLKVLEKHVLVFAHVVNLLVLHHNI